MPFLASFKTLLSNLSLYEQSTKAPGRAETLHCPFLGGSETTCQGKDREDHMGRHEGQDHLGWDGNRALRGSGSQVDLVPNVHFEIFTEFVVQCSYRRDVTSVSPHRGPWLCVGTCEGRGQFLLCVFDHLVVGHL